MGLLLCVPVQGHAVKAYEYPNAIYAKCYKIPTFATLDSAEFFGGNPTGIFETS